LQQSLAHLGLHAKDTIPAWVDRVEVQDSDGPTEYMMVNNAKSLVTLAQFGVIEFHPWGSRKPKLEQPDRLIFDFDLTTRYRGTSIGGESQGACRIEIAKPADERQDQRPNHKDALMELSLILRTSATLLAITAAGGLVMAVIRFAGKPSPPSWLAMVHGFLAAAGLTLLAYAYFTMAIPTFAAFALLLLLIAAVGGVVMNLGYHLNAVPLPKWLVVVHAAIAAIGFVLLLIAAWGGGRA